MEIQKLNTKEVLDIKGIVQFGTRLPEDYPVLFYKEVYNKDVKVRIRGLSNYEYDVINIEMYKDIKDPATIKYIFNPEKKEEIEDKIEEGKDKKDDLDVIALTKAYMLKDVLIVYYAMRDYYPNLALSDVEQLEGLRQIAERVDEKSGRTIEMMQKVKFFRDKRRKLDAPLSPQEGAQSGEGN